MVKKIVILKLNHRPKRDKRITTHCALVSRAFGGSKFYFSENDDPNLKKRIKNIVKKWGGNFKIYFCKDPIQLINKFKQKNGIVIHLTMYGEKVKKIIKIIKKDVRKNILIIIGGPKVPREYYDISDYNVSITNQPHSEVSALAIFLYLFNENIIDIENYKNNKIKIIPNNKVKTVINLK